MVARIELLNCMGNSTFHQIFRFVNFKKFTGAAKGQQTWKVSKEGTFGVISVSDQGFCLGPVPSSREKSISCFTRCTASGFVITCNDALEDSTLYRLSKYMYRQKAYFLIMSTSSTMASYLGASMEGYKAVLWHNADEIQFMLCPP